MHLCILLLLTAAFITSNALPAFYEAYQKLLKIPPSPSVLFNTVRRRMGSFNHDTRSAHQQRAGKRWNETRWRRHLRTALASGSRMGVYPQWQRAIDCDGSRGSQLHPRSRRGRSVVFSCWLSSLAVGSQSEWKWIPAHPWQWQFCRRVDIPIEWLAGYADLLYIKDMLTG